MEYFIINNKKSGKSFKIIGFNSYIVDQSIDIPADYFSFVTSNMDGQISSKISAGDEVFFYVNDTLVLNGLIDDLEIRGDDRNNSVEVVGRDKTLLLLDNDATPTTFYNINIENYLNKVIKGYGITKFIVEDTEIFNKIAISAGESEWSIIEQLCSRKGLYPRYDVDVLKCTSIRSDGNIDYYFSNDFLINNSYIKIKNYRINISSDIKSEVLVYSDSYQRKEDNEYSNVITIKGSAKDDNVLLKKRRIIHESDLESNTEANKIAKKELKMNNRKAFTIEIETHTSVPIYINKVARIIIKKLNIDILMLVSKVQYIRNESDGSITKIEFRLIEGQKINWDNHSIPIIPRGI